MKKIISLALVFALGVSTLVGYGTKEKTTEENTTKISDEKQTDNVKTDDTKIEEKARDSLVVYSPHKADMKFFFS